jgi:redox-sensitive bicupin YhaK (pirin superfamily)
LPSPPTDAVPSITAEGIYVTKPVWWLESRLHFSFAEYWDDKRMNFGALRVFNDDLVKPRAGFG